MIEFLIDSLDRVQIFVLRFLFFKIHEVNDSKQCKYFYLLNRPHDMILYRQRKHFEHIKAESSCCDLTDKIKDFFVLSSVSILCFMAKGN